MDVTSDRFGSGTRSRRAVLGAAGVASAGLLTGCAGTGESGTGDGSGSSGDGSGDGGGSASAGGSKGTEGGSGGDGATTWQTTELTDVRTDETFTIAGYEEPVVIQSFATWCSNCKAQSKQLKQVSDEVNLVGLNNDLEESASQVRSHAEEHGFDWRFAVASAEMMKSLRSEFGNVVAVAPQTPMIVHCPDGSAELNTGMSPDEVRSAVENC